MGKIHFLNVLEGDCSIIQHDSNNISIIDICNGNCKDKSYESVIFSSKNPKGNYNQKEYPTNPIEYIKSIGIETIFRFILTHPDMDHMDGLKELFKNFDVLNFWDTANNKVIEDGNFGQYNKEDWDYYQEIRKKSKSPKTLNLYEGNHGEFYNKNDYPNINGDELYILSPIKELIHEVNKDNSNNYNDLSYILLYKNKNKKILFTGDSEEKSWDILMSNKELRKKIQNIDVLIAPHHGRKSGGNDDFLDLLNPKLTLFGNAKSKDLNYYDWDCRKLFHITNNQAGNIILDIKDNIYIYCSNKVFIDNFHKDKNINSQQNCMNVGNYKYYLMGYI